MTTIPPTTLILTRPRPAAERFAAELGAWHGPILISPVLEIVPVQEPAPDASAQGLIFTSRAAVEHYPGPVGGPAHCVGRATTAQAEARGFEARFVGADAAQLVARLPALAPDTPLLHARGRHVAYPLAAKLSEAGLPCTEWIVYDQQPRPLSADVRSALVESAQGKRAVVLPVFSPRSADLLGDELRAIGIGGRICCVAISEAVATRIRSFTENAQILVAQTPDAPAMNAALHAAARHLHSLEG